jgi:imidazolonepropionase-like amidohydrolase
MENKKTSNLLRLTQYQRVRDLFVQALEYRKEWQDYEKKWAEYNESEKQKKEASAGDKAEDKAKGIGKDEKKAKEPEKPKRDEGKETLLQVIDKIIPLRVEAHRTDAILNALRLGQEFGFKIILERAEDWAEVLPQIQEAVAGLVSHPGLDYRKFLVPGGAKGHAAALLKLNADEFFYPDEEGELGPASQELEETWRNLTSSGALFALVPPDRFPLSARYLRFHASLLVAMGVSQEDALKAITSAPAEMLGVSDRVGSVEEGKDADLVVLRGEPLDSLSKVEMVLIKGKKVWESKNETD